MDFGVTRFGSATSGLLIRVDWNDYNKNNLCSKNQLKVEISPPLRRGNTGIYTIHTLPRTNRITFSTVYWVGSTSRI